MLNKVMGRPFGDEYLQMNLEYYAMNTRSVFMVQNAHLPGGIVAQFALCIGDTVLVINQLDISDPGNYSSYIDIHGNTTLIRDGETYSNILEARKMEKFNSAYPGFGTAATVKFLYVLGGAGVTVPEATRGTINQNVCTRDTLYEAVNRLLSTAKYIDYDDVERIIATMAYFAGEPNTSVTAYRRVNTFFWILGFVLLGLNLLIPGFFVLSMLHLGFTWKTYKGIAQKPFLYLIYTRIGIPLVALGVISTILQVIGLETLV